MNHKIILEGYKNSGVIFPLPMLWIEHDYCHKEMVGKQIRLCFAWLLWTIFIAYEEVEYIQKQEKD